jgi:hypothetical protein
MLLSGSINDMYNAGDASLPLNLDEETDKIINSSKCKQQSFFILFRVVYCKFVCEELFDQEIDRLSMLPLVNSPVRFLNEKVHFVEFTKMLKQLPLKWEESFIIVADIYFKCFGSNLFAKDGKKFDQYGDDFDKFMKYKHNHKL